MISRELSPFDRAIVEIQGWASAHRLACWWAEAERRPGHLTAWVPIPPCGCESVSGVGRRAGFRLADLCGRGVAGLGVGVGEYQRQAVALAAQGVDQTGQGALGEARCLAFGQQVQGPSRTTRGASARWCGLKSVW
ncbi:hypothetical protein D3C85_495790 [compost metagenome]